MSINFSLKWRQYHKLIEVVSKLKVQSTIFPNRKNVVQEYKEKREELFNYYEGFTNMSNTINPVVLRVTMKEWFSKNCDVKSPQEVEKWLQEQNWKDANIIRYIADDIVGANLCKLCFYGGHPFCPQTKGDETSCATKLISEIIKSSDRYTHIPNTEENFELFINGGSQYMKKEVTIQDSSASPIEDIMYEALSPIAKKYGYKIEREYPVYDEGRLEIRYSLDLVFVDTKNKAILDVECDGLSFHGGYDSMSNDRARDRWLLIRGLPVMRFTSRDIFNDLDNCVVQVEYALKTISKWNR